MEAVENRTFVKDFGRGRIEIFGFSGSYDTSGERYDVPGIVGNGKNYPTIEFVSSGSDEYARIENVLFGDSTGFKFCEKFSGVSRVANLEFRNGFVGQSARTNVFEFFAIFGKEQFRVVGFGSNLVDFVDVAPAFGIARKIAFQFDPGFFCKDLERLPEFDLFDFHKEIDWTAALVARKTVGDVFCWRHDERRRFFVMERTTRLKIHSSFFKRNVFGNQLNDVDAVFYVFRNRHSALIGFVVEYNTPRRKGNGTIGKKTVFLENFFVIGSRGL